jgi:transglutaminase-like putative cysteine protease
MRPETKKRVGLALGAIGVGAAVAALILIGRRQMHLAGLGRMGLVQPKYRFVNRRHAQAPMVGSSEAGGMRIEHRRSAAMPIEERVASIQDLVWKGVQDPRMRKLALGITKHCPERDGMCESKAIYDYVKQRVRYTGDVGTVKMGRNGPVEGIDLFQAGKRTLEFGGGDCDDHSILIATLLAHNGITPRLRVTASTRNGEDEHIYPLAGLPKTAPAKWVAIDTTLPGDNKFGVEYPAGRITDFPA